MFFFGYVHNQQKQSFFNLKINKQTFIQSIVIFYQNNILFKKQKQVFSYLFIKHFLYKEYIFYFIPKQKDLIKKQFPHRDLNPGLKGENLLSQPARLQGINLTDQKVFPHRDLNPGLKGENLLSQPARLQGITLLQLILIHKFYYFLDSKLTNQIECDNIQFKNNSSAGIKTSVQRVKTFYPNLLDHKIYQVNKKQINKFTYIQFYIFVIYLNKSYQKSIPPPGLEPGSEG
ncbi:hypothetical protein TTHERM_000974164 (macronuclear) [Tetrahymena thermophila SB210]|uniref:Uncharacterized protein n=1 Tax=Tetrahymena thermophila (strain SB210) TaxID=312017 RepID=W7X942_TETTS|nr:hypothetical protein TTHERM_000974164 [Tetrahymena thermophila SB210]EWS75920.1 hypothetical protein TTHERM_000974164 [Tetrahymena thermophila SB210]|eukprot:XP_012651545.1 hypothetical protein TTHERM_000974164 [Tetrahymena thermophila SB210]